MSKANNDGITPPPSGAPPAFTTILFLPGAAPAIVAAGAQRNEGWVGECPVAEADDLCRRQLAIAFPHDWPALPPPNAGGEPFPNFVEREILGHPTVIAIMELGASMGLKAPIISPVRPGERTVQWWLRKYQSDRPHYCIANHHRETTLLYYCKYLIWRLMVHLFDRLRDGEWGVFGLLAGAAEYTLQPIGRGQWHHVDMVLNYRRGGDWFRPQQRPGWPAPAASMAAYCGLMLRARAAPDTPAPPPSDRRPTPTNPAVRQWMRGRVAEWPDDKPAPNEKEDWTAATAYFAPKLSRKEFRSVRDAETPNAWRRQGPRPPWGDVKQSFANPPIRGRQI